MVLFKHMDQDTQKQVLECINTLWRNEETDTEITAARVASIYKKGDPKNQENYRPISLLNTIYKLYTYLIKQRLEEGTGK